MLTSDDDWLAFNGSQVVGFVSVKDGWLNQLCVDPAHWRCCLGSKLMAIAKASSPELQLWAVRDNAMARSFYATRGF